MNVQASLYSTLQGEQFTDFDIHIFTMSNFPPANRCFVSLNVKTFF